MAKRASENQQRAQKSGREDLLEDVWKPSLGPAP
jgi:hypothetical protein